MASSPHAISSNYPRKPHRVSIAVLASFMLLHAAGCAELACQGRNAEGARLYSQGRYQEALRQFQEAAYSDPFNADGYYNLAATHHRLGVLENRQSDLDQAEDYYNQCLDRDPNHCECHRGLAVLLAEQGRNEEAFRLLEGWVDRQPEAADPKIELARLFEEFGDRSAAKEHLIEAVNVDPDNPRALAALGKIHEEGGAPDQALADYQRSYQSDRFQSQVAARIAALRSSTAPPIAGMGPDGPTRLVDRQSTSWR